MLNESTQKLASSKVIEEIIMCCNEKMGSTSFEIFMCGDVCYLIKKMIGDYRE